MADAFDHDGLSACLGQTSSDGCGQAVRGVHARASSGSAASLGWLTLVPGLIGVAARGAVRARARERHLPARLDAEHHAPALDRDQARRRRRRGAARGARADRCSSPGGARRSTASTADWTTTCSTSRAPSRSATRSSRSGSRSRSASSGGGRVPALVVASRAYVAARIFVESWLRQRFVDAAHRDLGPARQPGPSTEQQRLGPRRPSDRLGHHLHRQLGVFRRAPVAQRPKGLDPSCIVARRRLQPRRLPAGEPLLALPGHRDRALRRRRAPADRVAAAWLVRRPA